MVSVIPEELVRLSGVCQTEAGQVSDAWTGGAEGMAIPAGAAGTTPGAATLLDSHVEAGEAAGQALDHVSAVLELDLDGLLLCAFAFSEVDEQTADAFRSDVPHPSPGPSPEPSGPGSSEPEPEPEPAPEPTPEPTPAPTPPPPED